MEDTSRLAMVAAYPDESTQKLIRELVGDIDGAHPADDLHCTLLFLGKIGDMKVRPEELAEHLRGLAPTMPIEAQVGGQVIFGDDEAPVTVLLVDGKEIAHIHTDIERASSAVGAPSASEHGFTAHMTVADGNHHVAVPRGTPLVFDRLAVEAGDDRYWLTADNKPHDVDSPLVDALRALVDALSGNMEEKERRVQDADYWGLPVGTPIKPGMKPVRVKPKRPKIVLQHARARITAWRKTSDGLTIDKDPAPIPPPHSFQSVEQKPLDYIHQPVIPIMDGEMPHSTDLAMKRVVDSAREGVANDFSNDIAEAVKARVNDAVGDRILDTYADNKELQAWVQGQLAKRIGYEMQTAGPDELDAEELRSAARHQMRKTLIMRAWFERLRRTPDFNEKYDAGDYDNYTDDELLVRWYVRLYIEQWAGTSGDSNYQSIMMQKATNEVFGLKAPTGHMDSDYIDYDRDESENPMRYAFLRAQYEETQEMFANMGVTHVMAHRGVGFQLSAVPADMLTPHQQALLNGREDRWKTYIEDDLDEHINTYLTLIGNTWMREEASFDPRYRDAFEAWRDTPEAIEKFGERPESEFETDPADSFFRKKYRNELLDKARAAMQDDVWGYRPTLGDWTAPSFEQAMSTSRVFMDARIRANQELVDDLVDDMPAIVPVYMQPMSSWSVDEAIATRFAAQMADGPLRMRFAARIPVSRIIASTLSGSGCLNESEIVVLGGADEVGTSAWKA